MQFHLGPCVLQLMVYFISSSNIKGEDVRLRAVPRSGRNAIPVMDNMSSSHSNISIVTRTEISLQRFVAIRNEIDVCNINMTSCQNSCNDFRATPCSCDDLCQVYENCCEDYFDVCSSTRLVSSSIVPVINTTVTCPPFVNFLLLSDCPADVNTNASRRCLQPSPTSIEDMIPVTPKGFPLYFKNRYCAECNGFVHYDYWLGTVMGTDGFRGLQAFIHDLTNLKVTINWKKNQVKRYLRPCFPSAHLPSKMTSDADAKSVLCNAFTSYVYSNSSDVYYRNKYCIDGIGDNSESISCEPVTDITTTWTANSSFTFEKRTEENEWLISRMTNRNNHIDSVVCYSNATGACKIISCVEGYSLQGGSCQRRPMKLNIEMILNPSDFGIDNAPYDSMKSFVSKLSQYLTRHMNAVGANGSRCSLDSETKSLIISDDLSWKLKQEFLCTYGNEVIDKRELFLTDVSIKLSKGFTAALSRATLYIDAKLTACVADEDSASDRYDFCFESATNRSRPIPHSSYVESVISDICCTMSVLGLFIRIVLQPVIPFYKSTPGKVQFCLCTTLFVAYIVFLVGGIVQEGSVVCTVLAVLTHWGFLSALLWMNVIAFTMWQTFRSWKNQLNSQSTFALTFSALFATIPPLLTIVVGLLMDHFIHDSPYSPNYGANLCWITKTSSMIVFFVIPSNTITIINSVLVYLALLGIWKERKAFREVASSNNKADLELAVKVIVLVGVTWLVGLIGIVLKYEFAWMMFTIINGSLGFLISFALLCNKRVYRILKNLVCRCIGRFNRQRTVDLSVATASTLSTYRVTTQS